MKALTIHLIDDETQGPVCKIPVKRDVFGTFHYVVATCKNCLRIDPIPNLHDAFEALGYADTLVWKLDKSEKARKADHDYPCSLGS